MTKSNKNQNFIYSNCFNKNHVVNEKMTPQNQTNNVTYFLKNNPETSNS